MMTKAQAKEAVRNEMEAYDRFSHIHPEAREYDIGVMCLYLDSLNLKADLRTLVEAWNVVRA